jgi:peroxiredoxin
MYEKAARQLTERGIQLVVVSPSVENEKPLYPAELELDHIVLDDPSFSVARLLFGILDAEDEKKPPLPASFLVGRGRLRYQLSSDDAGALFDRDQVTTMLAELTGSRA